LAPVSFVNAARAAADTSPAMIYLGKTISVRTKPRARAVAILPAPRKPMVSLVAMEIV